MALRKLNLVMTYPVHWSLYMVMSNFVQNFYDAIGKEDFIKNFYYEFKDDAIVLKSNVGFCKEWLFFMGTSSKRVGDRTYAGRFGEGFKVASLVAYRDMKLGIKIESQDWCLTITEAEDQIDGKEIKVLAYDITERAYEENTIMTITNAKEEHFEEMKSQINDFYYAENPRFGKCISKGDDYAVYHVVEDPKRKRNKGRLFINLQYRDPLGIPIVVCNHRYTFTGDDRDRTEISLYDSNEAIREVFRKLSPSEALEVLEICKPVWRNHYDKSYYGRNWFRMLEILGGWILDNRESPAFYEQLWINVERENL